MTHECVSAVIPAYNYARFVCDAVDSALAQTWPNIEVIVVDDGSIDDTRRRLEPYGDRIRYIYQDNRGLSAARNAGIRAARGEWIALLDADDIWHRQKTAIQLAAGAASGTPALIGSPPADVLPDRLSDTCETRSLKVCDFLFAVPVGPSGVLVRREAFEKAGMFDESLRSVEDRDMWLRIAARDPAIAVESPCWTYRRHEGQMNRCAERMFTNYRLVLNRFFETHAENADLRAGSFSYMYADAAWSYFVEGDRTTALRLLFRSFWLHPAAYRGPQGRPRWWRHKSLLRYLAGDKLFRALCPGVK